MFFDQNGIFDIDDLILNLFGISFKDFTLER